MSLYKQYMRERGVGIIEDEYSFCTYEEIESPIEPGMRMMYIMDIYVVPEKRETNRGKEMSTEVAKIAHSKGLDYILGSTDLDKPNVELSLKAIMGDNFRYYGRFHNMIYWIKNIRSQ